MLLDELGERGAGHKLEELLERDCGAEKPGKAPEGGDRRDVDVAHLREPHVRKEARGAARCWHVGQGRGAALLAWAAAVDSAGGGACLLTRSASAARRGTSSMSS